MPLPPTPPPSEDPESPLLREDLAPYGVAPSTPREEHEDLIRTQIHLSEAQRSYLADQAKLSGLSMAAQIRKLIDEQMNPTQTNWVNNPLLEDTIVDPDFTASPEASTSSDSLIYGSYEG